MAKTLEELVSEGKDLAAKAVTFRGKKGALDEKEFGEYEKTVARMGEIKAEIDRNKKARDLDGKAGDFEAFMGTPVLPAPMPGSTDGAGSRLLWQDAGSTDIDKRSRKFVAEQGAGILGKKAWDAISDDRYGHYFGEYIRKGESGMSGAAKKALEDGLDPQGGYLAPAEFIARIIERKPSPNRLYGLVDRLTTGRDAINIPKNNYTGSSADDPNGYLFTTGFRLQFTTEDPASDTAADVADSNLFGSLRIGVHTAMINGKLTNDQVEDAAFNVNGWLEKKFQESVDGAREILISKGTGNNQPTGFLSNVSTTDPNYPSFNTSGGSGVLLPDDVVGIADDIPEQYEEGCRYIFNKTSTRKALRLMKDSQNRYLFGMGYQDSGMSTPPAKELNGYQYTVSQYMPNIATGNIPLWFGDLGGYTWVDRVGFSIQILRELYAKRNQIGVLGRVRFGGTVTEPWRMKGLKVA